MKLELVIKIDMGKKKKKKKNIKKIDDSVMSTNCNVNVNFVIYDQFRAIQKLDSKH